MMHAKATVSQDCKTQYYRGGVSLSGFVVWPCLCGQKQFLHGDVVAIAYACGDYNDIFCRKCILVLSNMD